MTIKKAIATLEKSEDLKLVMLAKGMNKKYDKYWGTFDKINQLLLYANVLDPRWKFVFVRWCLSKHYDKKVVDHKILEMKEGMTRLYNWYEMRSIQYADEHNVGESRNMEKNAKGKFDFCDEMESDFESFMQAENNMVAKSELERYWSESNESNEKKDEDGKPEFNVLGWWKEKCSKYPILSQMARDILAIPVSTVASESAFSTGGRILDPYRTSLSPKVAEALICAQNWLKNPTQISLREMLDEVERIDSEIGPALQEDSCITDL